MRLETIEKLCCPFDKSDLTLKIITKGEENTILEGILSCAECKRVYPIVTGIPIMNPDEFRNFELEQPMLDKWEKMLGGKKGQEFNVINGEIKAIE